MEPLLAPLSEYWVVLGPSACTLGPIAYGVGARKAEHYGEGWLRVVRGQTLTS